MGKYAFLQNCRKEIHLNFFYIQCGTPKTKEIDYFQDTFVERKIQKQVDF